LFLVGLAWHDMAATCIYVSATVFPGHGLGQSDHPGLGSTVVGLPNVADDPGNRRDVDDPSLRVEGKSTIQKLFQPLITPIRKK
jgi:hypothetical protein